MCTQHHHCLPWAAMNQKGKSNGGSASYHKTRKSNPQMNQRKLSAASFVFVSAKFSEKTSFWFYFFDEFCVFLLLPPLSSLFCRLPPTLSNFYSFLHREIPSGGGPFVTHAEIIYAARCYWSASIEPIAPRELSEIPRTSSAALQLVFMQDP